MTRRIGRDNSLIPLVWGRYGLGFAVPRWIWLVVLYFILVFGLTSAGAWLGPETAKQAGAWVAALYPGAVGLFDLMRRLRTARYAWVHPIAGETVLKASVVDRLTFRECGWRLPLLSVPLPLWAAGLGLSVAFLNAWDLV